MRPLFQFFFFSGANLYAGQGYPAMDGGLTISGVTGLRGPGQIDPFSFIQNKFSYSEEGDIFWTRGAHSVRFGGEIKERSAERRQSSVPWGRDVGLFQSLKDFLRRHPTQYKGPALAVRRTQNIFDPFPNLPFSAYHKFRENDYALYIQDDWKASPTLTLNLGLRYEPTTNPHDLNAASAILNPPFAEGTNNSITAVDGILSGDDCVC